MLKRYRIGGLVLTAVLVANAASADDVLWVGSWQLKPVDTKFVDLVHYGELHVSDHAPAPLQYQLTGRVVYEPWKSLGFALGYSYLERQVHNAATDDWDDVYTHRFEVEVNPRWDLGKSVRLSLRNRFEERWVEDKAGTYPRTRHRLELAVPVKNAGPVSEVFSFVEPFFDLRTGKNSEDRYAPLGVTFRLSKHVSLRTYYVWQTVQGPSGWSNNHMLWTHWNINLW